MNVKAVKNFNTLDLGIRLLFLIILGLDDSNKITLKKADMTEFLNVSRQTAGRYIKTFVGCGMLKYKHSGLTFVNPDFYYIGKESERERIKEEYNRFNSDM